MSATTVLWLVLLVAFGLTEGYALASGQPTLSMEIRALRYDALGRFIVLPLGTWLAWHLFARPEHTAHALSWRDAIAIAVGIAWAVWEARR